MAERPTYSIKKNKPIPEEPKPRSNKKDTKHWCRGKVGRTHKLEWINWPNEHYSKWHADRGVEHCKVRACTVCGKQFEICWNSSWMRKQECICGLHKKTNLQE